MDTKVYKALNNFIELYHNVYTYTPTVTLIKTDVFDIVEEIISLMNAAGDNSCHLKGDECSLPPWEEFQESCKRHHAQVTANTGILEGCKTIAQLEQENRDLRNRLRAILPYCRNL
jgi:hypothetical protein